MFKKNIYNLLNIDLLSCIKLRYRQCELSKNMYAEWPKARFDYLNPVKC